jgi:PmbA protein
MNDNDRKALVDWAMDIALKNGADATGISLGQTRSINIKHRDHKLEEVTESTQNGISFAIYSNEKYSSQSTSNLKKDSLKKFIIDSIKRTQYLTKDEFRSLPDPSLYPTDTNVNLQVSDPKYPKLESHERVKLAQEIENSAWSESDNIISVTSEFGDTFHKSILAHSNGFFGETESTKFSCGAEVTVKDGESGRPSDWSWAVARYLDDLPNMEFLGKDATLRALAKIGQRKIESGKYNIVVRNRAMGNLIRVLTGPMAASLIQQKNSFLEDKQGQQIASPLLTIKDNPFIARGLGSRLFDDEGIAAANRILIEKGVLKEYFVDNYYGKKLGWKPNSSSYGNMEFDYGKSSEGELVQLMESGILITGFIGGNMNSSTGDFSYGIIGQLVENGNIIHAINEMNITGNGKSFWNNLVAVGNDPITYSAQRRPSMMFKDADLSGL